MQQTLGKRIIAHRKRLGLTQDALAEKLGVTAQAVSKWENDQSCPDITMLPRLAGVFGTTTDELLGVAPREEVHEGEVVTPQEQDSEEAEGVHTPKGEFEFQWDSGRWEAMTFAVLVLVVGSLTLAARLMDWSVNFWDILWPTTLLVYGIKYMLARFTLLRLAVSLTGLYFLTANLNSWTVDLGIEYLFPVALLVVGVSLLFSALRKPKRPRVFVHCGDHNPKANRRTKIEGDHFDCTAAFCEEIQYIDIPNLRSGSASVSFGEMTIDLTGVGEISENCLLDLRCSFGQLTLQVPKKYQVTPMSSNFFSGTSVSGTPSDTPESIIRVRSSASFGEICIRYV